MHLPPKHSIAAAVALASFGLALNRGGFSLGFLAGAAFAIWWVVLLGLCLRELPRLVPTPAAVAAGTCLALLAAWTALSIGWASDDGAAFAELVRVLAYLGLFALVVLVSGSEGGRPWLAGLAIGLTAVVAIGLAGRFDPSLGDGDLTGARLSHPIGYWNAFAACAAFSVVLLGWHSANGERRITRSLSTSLLPLPALAIFLSGSRGGAAAALIGAALLVALGPRRWALAGGLGMAAAGAAALIGFADTRSALLDGATGGTAAAEGHQLLGACIAVCAAIGIARHALDGRLMEARLPPAGRRVTAAAAVLALVAVIVAQDPADRFERFKEPPQNPAQASTSSNFTNDNGSGRYQFWGAALDAFEHQPLRGIGAGQYATWWNQHGSIYWVLRDAHSLLLEIAAELGVVGLALIAAFLLIPALAGSRGVAIGGDPAAGGLLAILVVGAFSASIDWMLEVPAAFAPAVVAAALLSGAATRGGRTAAGWAREALERRRVLLGVATGLLAWVALWCTGDQLLARVKLDESRSAAAEGDYAAAAEAANDAIALQPWAAEPRLQLGFAQQGIGDLHSAAATFRGAAERAAEDWRPWFVLSQAEIRLGRRAAARDALARARALSPRAPLLRAGSP
jgi:O-antigen ligase